MIKNINIYIDHTILKPFAGENEVKRVCDEAIAMNAASVCINPCNVALARRLLEGTDIEVCTVIGFPLGQNTTAIKAAETEQAYNDGCQEFDMVINVGALHDKRFCLFICADSRGGFN